LCIVLALLLALAVRPDDGTPVTGAPADAAALVAGAHHAKPLPRVPVVPSVTSIVAVLLPTLGLVLAAAAFVQRRRRVDAAPPETTPWSLAPARRGPPALV
jgi:hypothetical protein